MSSSTRCTICNRPEANACTQCHASAYCSTACQKYDWPVHKLLCKSYAAFLPTRPSALHFATILFPVDAPAPQLIWVECAVAARLSGPTQVPQPDGVLGYPIGNQERVPINFSHTRQFGMTNKSVVVTSIYEEDFPGALPLNVSIRNTVRKSVRTWTGPTVVMSQPGKEFRLPTYQDVTLADLRVAVDMMGRFVDEDQQPKHGSWGIVGEKGKNDYNVMDSWANYVGKQGGGAN